MPLSGKKHGNPSLRDVEYSDSHDDSQRLQNGNAIFAREHYDAEVDSPGQYQGHWPWTAWGSLTG